jgi:hypothetical protein
LQTILVAVLSFVGTCIGSIAAIMTSNRLVTYRIDQLEMKVQKHNDVINRTYILEEQMKVANHRIEDLEEGEKNAKA